MQKQLLHFLKGFIPFTILLYGIHYFLIIDMEGVKFFYSLPAIYLFHVLATLLIYIGILLVYKNYSDYTGYAFMGAGLLKMMAAVLFLLPMLLAKTKDPFINILSFFIPYFLYLVFETFYAVKLLNAKK